ncbi:hypothetical protein J8E27_09260 [Brucella sp. 458]|uniref:hypothetical protein n=1 Tax=Brucella sp. 458 TaxID=2821140 RepID=UPI001ADF9482|nr:hypothetical protein [Brucella sp. 458]QTN99572.1 hypothetical protein J8E27_09260 [Brucella sp. 458]
MKQVRKRANMLHDPSHYVLQCLDCLDNIDIYKAYIIRVTDKAFDDFASGGTDEAANRRMLGL